MQTLAERILVGSAIEEAATLLPDGWTISITIEHNSASVSLYDPEGLECEFPSNRERLSDEIRDAVESAVEECKNKQIVHYLLTMFSSV